MNVTSKATVCYMLAKQKEGGTKKFFRLPLEKRKVAVINKVREVFTDSSLLEQREVLSKALEITAKDKLEYYPQ
jgi:hypothetical protein